MLSNRQRGALLKITGITVVLGVVSLVIGGFGVTISAGPYASIALLFAGFIIGMTAIHIDAMGYHRNRGIFASFYRATIGEFGLLVVGVTVVFFIGLVGASVTSGSAQLFILFVTMVVSVLGVVADVVRRFNRFIRAHL